MNFMHSRERKKSLHRAPCTECKLVFKIYKMKQVGRLLYCKNAGSKNREVIEIAKEQKILEAIGPSPIFMQLDNGDSALILSAPDMNQFYSLVGLLKDFEEIEKRLGKYSQRVDKNKP